MVASTPVAGFALQNATPIILSWTAPADGLNHSVFIPCSLAVSAAETGGLIVAATVAPDGTTGQSTLESAGQGIGQHPGQIAAVIKPGSTVTVQQTSALTAGAATLWAQMWAG